MKTTVEERRSFYMMTRIGWAVLALSLGGRLFPSSALAAADVESRHSAIATAGPLGDYRGSIQEVLSRTEFQGIELDDPAQERSLAPIVAYLSLSSERFAALSNDEKIEAIDRAAQKARAATRAEIARRSTAISDARDADSAYREAENLIELEARASLFIDPESRSELEASLQKASEKVGAARGEALRALRQAAAARNDVADFAAVSAASETALANADVGARDAPSQLLPSRARDGTAEIGIDAAEPPSPRKSVFQVLSRPENNRNYWVWVSGQGLNAAFGSAQGAALPDILGAGPDQAGVRGYNRMADSGVGALANLLMPAWADRSAPLPFMMWSMIAAGLVLFSIPVLMLFGIWNIWLFTALGSAATFAGMSGAAAGSVVYNHVVGPDRSGYVKANAWQMAILAGVGTFAPWPALAFLSWLAPILVSGLQRLLGPLPVADHVVLFGSVLASGLGGIGFIVSALYLRFFLKLPEALAAAPAPPRPLLREIFSGFAKVAGHPTLRLVLLCSALSILSVNGMIFSIIPSFLATLPAILFGFALVMSINSAATGVASVYMILRKNGPDDPAELLRLGRRTALVRAVGWLCFAAVFFAGWLPSWAALPAAGLMLLVSGVLQVPANLVWSGIQTDVARNELRQDQAKVGAAMALFGTLLNAFGNYAFGPLLTTLDFSIRWKIAVAALIGCAVCDVLLSRLPIPTAGTTESSS